VPSGQSTRSWLAAVLLELGFKEAAEIG